MWFLFFLISVDLPSCQSVSRAQVLFPQLDGRLRARARAGSDESMSLCFVHLCWVSSFSCLSQVPTIMAVFQGKLLEVKHQRNLSISILNKSYQASDGWDADTCSSSRLFSSHCRIRKSARSGNGEGLVHVELSSRSYNVFVRPRRCTICW